MSKLITDHFLQHYFLQNLPSIPRLRALYIPFLVNNPRNSVDTKELALQIVDIVVLRPEIQLCYIGIVKKCFEILEQRPGQGDNDHGVNGSGTIEDVSGGEEEDVEDDEDEVDD